MNTDMLVGTATSLHNGKVRKATKNFSLRELKTFINGWDLVLANVGTSGAATLVDNVLNIPIYQGAITLTTTGSSGSATLIGNTLNIPNYTTPTPTLDSVLAEGNIGYAKDISLLREGTPLYQTGGVITLTDETDGNNGNTFQVSPLSAILADITGQLEVSKEAITRGEGANSTSLIWDTLSSVANVVIPNISGTIALTSQIPSVTGYVPYTGATADVDLGEKELTTGKLYLYDAVGGPTEKGSLHYADEALHFENSEGETLMYIEPGFMQIHKTGTIQSNLFTTLLTTNRDHYLPNASGTIALTSQIGTWGALSYPTWTSGTPFVKMTAAGTFALDTNTYLTGITSSNVTTALGYTPVTNARTITINGTTYDLTANRSWTIPSNPGTVTSVAALTLGTTGTDLSSSVTNGMTTPVITLNVPTASATNRGVLSNSDWNTFNNKQNALVYTPYRYLNTTQSTVTGTVAETIVSTATITGNTFNANDIMKMFFYISRATISTTAIMRIKINTSNTLSGALQLGQYSISSTNNSALIQRNFTISSGNIYGYSNTTSVTNDSVVSISLPTITTYNPANTIYVFFTITNGNTVDNSTFLMANITN
jgi:hypothetical protein